MAEIYNKESEAGSGGEVKKSAIGDKPCAEIKDPIRKTFCRVCQVPVVGEAPFCKDHEPPVP